MKSNALRLGSGVLQPVLLNLVACGVWLAAAGCGGGSDGGGRQDGPRAGRAGHAGAAATDFGNASGQGSASGSTAIPDGGGRAARGDGGLPDTCAVTGASTALEPVYLAFAFDVSGSMGKGDEKWHDKSLKWDPVVAATRAFFEDGASEGLTASLTFFPAEGDDDERCVEDVYEKPDVKMTALPSGAFGDAIARIEPEDEDDWRGGTPTAWVMRGTRAFVERYRDGHPGRFAIVLVTDGYPQGCDDDDDTIEAVVDEAEGALKDGVPTYVIGVANPKIDGAPDTVSDLQAIASAGGTDQAYLIDTGDPTQTTGAFGEAVAQIRSASIRCDLAIPQPGGGATFDKERIAVTYDTGAGAHTALRYDSTCSGDDAWRYDDADAPAEIVLCPDTCDAVKADPEAALRVEFACERLFSVD
jgi:hypothetical protein